MFDVEAGRDMVLGLAASERTWWAGGPMDSGPASLLGVADMIAVRLADAGETGTGKVGICVKASGSWTVTPGTDGLTPDVACAMASESTEGCGPHSMRTGTFDGTLKVPELSGRLVGSSFKFGARTAADNLLGKFDL